MTYNRKFGIFDYDVFPRIFVEIVFAHGIDIFLMVVDEGSSLPE
jgi:hypothetical protein